MSNSKLVIETARKLDELYNQYYFQSKSLDEVIELALYKKEFWSQCHQYHQFQTKSLNGLRADLVTDCILFTKQG